MSTTLKGAEKYLLDSGKVYLDNAATSLKNHNVIRNLNEYGKRFQLNPMSGNSYSNKTLEALDKARLDLLNYFNLNDIEYEVIFTSGSTESLNLVIQSIFLSRKKSRVISSVLEHKAVLNTIHFLESIGAEVTFLKNDVNGLISMEDLRCEINAEVSFVSLMHVNNETGVVNNVNQISNICNEQGVPFICDTTQSAGKIPFDGELFDAFVGSAHKFGGPFGVGFLVLKKELLKNPVIYGGGQEFGLRSGTHNLPGILAMIDALRIDYSLDYSFINDVINDIGLDIKDRIGEKCCDFIYAFEVEDIVDFELTNSNYIFGRGSSCNSGLLKPSHVYSALGYDENVVRISF